uniref:Uncharacterized protein n=2 Tax=unclassified bacterial viruses TaxID=12333 RepID=A0AAU6VZ80_9VIRU
MSLHNEIMNIPTKTETLTTEVGCPRDYKLGHRDARHVAAELALKYDGYIERLEDHIKALVDAIELAELGKILGNGEALIGATRREAGL